MEQIAERYNHKNWKSTNKKSLNYLWSFLNILHSNYLYFCSNWPLNFAIFLKGSLLLNNFYCLSCLWILCYGSIIQKLEHLWMQKFQFVICVKVIIYLLLYKLHGCNINSESISTQSLFLLLAPTLNLLCKQCCICNRERFRDKKISTFSLTSFELKKTNTK